MFKEIKVWKRIDAQLAIRYCCLQDLRSAEYAVQNMDCFRLPIDPAQMHFFDQQFVELFIEEPAKSRCNWFQTIQAAIAAHDKEFGNAVSLS